MQMVTKEDIYATLKTLQESPTIPIAAASNKNSGIQMHIRPPFSHSSYFGLAQLLDESPRGRMIRTPYGKSELIVGVAFGIPWINASLHNYLNAVQPPSERLQRLREVNVAANQRTIPFFLTLEGRLYYKLVVDPEYYPVYEFGIAPEEISLAENALTKVRMVTYSPFGGVLALFSEDGLVIDNLAPVTSIARLELI